VSTELLERICREISERGPMPFARFMERALYESDLGYYSRESARLGREGDFVTASDAGRAFGRCVARQLSEIDRATGPFHPFDVVEFGPGRGLLARDVLDGLAELDPALHARTRYSLVERSPSLLAAARNAVPEAQALTPGQLADTPRRGCVLAVELFDALPVHRLRRRDGRRVELFVDVDDAGGLVEVERAPTPEARRIAERYGAAAEEGLEAEVAPDAPEQLDALLSAIECGVLIIVDYGDRAERLYDRGRARGTLLAYHRHATNEAYLERVGEQDLTAHVNFSLLEDHARERGARVLGLTTQDRFLIGNGIMEAFEERDDASWHDPRRVKQRLQAMQLIHPETMGRAFKFLLLAKACNPAALSGLQDPFARDQ